MIAAQIPENDRERLEAVRRYSILDTPPDGSFDNITALAARLFDVPIAIVSIVDEDRIWFKSRFGLDDIQEIARDGGLCASAISAPGIYLVESAHTDARTLANPLVAGEMGLRFYAAAPLQTHDGFRLGNLCILDRRTRRMSGEQMETLEALGRIVMDALELRLSAMRAVSNVRLLHHEASESGKTSEGLYQREHQVAITLQKAMLPRAFPVIKNVRFDAVYAPAGIEAVVGGDWYDAYLVDADHLLLSIGDVTGHGLAAAAVMGALRQSLRAFARTEPSPSKLLELLDETLRSEYEDMLVTAFVAIVDLRTNRMHYANAGHPPPLLRHADGEISELTGTGLPLGLRSGHEPSDSTVVIESTSILLLHTDGLTEATRNLLEGEKSLKAAFAVPNFWQLPNPAHALCATLLPTSSHDDVAVMTVSFD